MWSGESWRSFSGFVSRLLGRSNTEDTEVEVRSFKNNGTDRSMGTERSRVAPKRDGGVVTQFLFRKEKSNRLKDKNNPVFATEGSRKEQPRL